MDIHTWIPKDMIMLLQVLFVPWPSNTLLWWYWILGHVVPHKIVISPKQMCKLFKVCLFCMWRAYFIDALHWWNCSMTLKQLSKIGRGKYILTTNPSRSIVDIIKIIECTRSKSVLGFAHILCIRIHQEYRGWIITCTKKCGVKLLIHSQTSTVQPLKFGNG